MIISYHVPYFIFVHIYKAAGNSIATSLDPLGQRRPQECIFERDQIQHLSAKHLKAGLPRHVWTRSFRFAFVRNPWDRWVSLYEYIVARPNNRDHELIMRLGSFDSFIRWVYSGDNPEILITRSQQDFLCDDDGNLLVDFIGKVENLADDLEMVWQRLGVRGAPLKHLNVTPHRHYISYYTPETRALVETNSQFDMEMLGYTFGG